MCVTVITSIEVDDDHEGEEVSEEAIREVRIFFETERTEEQGHEPAVDHGQASLFHENDIKRCSSTSQQKQSLAAVRETEEDDLPPDLEPYYEGSGPSVPSYGKETRRYTRKRKRVSETTSEELGERPIFNVRNKGGRPANVQRMFVNDPSLFHCPSCHIAFQTQEARDVHINAMRGSVCRNKHIPKTLRGYDDDNYYYADD